MSGGTPNETERPFLVLGALLGIALLVKHTRLGNWITRRAERGEARRLQYPIYALLRREVQVLGKDLEGLPYERLLEFDDSLVYTSKVIGSVEIHFTAEQVNVNKNGDLQICIDARVEAPGWPWRGDALPSYHFYKRKDGTVYY